MNMPTQENIIFQTQNIDKIYVKEQKGFYQRIRRYLGWFLTTVFILTPFIQYDGQQAILFDVADQSLNVFSVVLFPQDLLIFAFAFILSAISLFYISTKYGRIWCGFACPQTIWTTMFIWVEHRIEGSRNKRIQLDLAPWSIKKTFKKVLKHFVWIVISVLTATVFMSYFTPAKTIYWQLAMLEMPNTIFAWVAFFSICTYLNGGIIREKMCEHMCPYSRFQSVMFNRQTKIVTYDAQRGEKRGPRKRNQAKPAAIGDCVDCNLCVHVCPVGIDIRNGMQYQCISCGLCIDACDQTMKQFNYKTGLIKYSGESKKSGQVSPNMFYIIVIAVLFISSVIWASFRSPYEISVIKDRNALYRTVNFNKIENSFQLKLFNKTKQPARFVISLDGLPNFNITSSPFIHVSPLSSTITTLTVSSPEEYDTPMAKFSFVIEHQDSGKVFNKETTFHALQN